MSSPASPFLERMILFLMPYFLSITPDLALARAEIIETLASYGARTRAEVLNAVQIMAFSLSALDLLAESKATEMSPTLRLRFRACATSLNRACQQNQKALTASLACDQPDTAAPVSLPDDGYSEEQIKQTLRQVRAKIDATRNRLSNIGPATAQQTPSPGADHQFHRVVAGGTQSPHSATARRPAAAE